MPRLHISRVIMPFFLGAVCTYAVLILYSYPRLTGTHFNRRSAEEFKYGNSGDHYVDGHVERIPRQHRQIGRERHKKMDIIDKVLLMKKRAALEQMEYELTEFDDRNKLAIKLLKVKHTNDKSPADDSGRNKALDAGQTRNEEIVRPGQVLNAELNKPAVTYNKDITVPKHRRYVDEPVDAHHYGFIHQPNLCRREDGRRIKVLLMFMVTTAPGHFTRRQLIRRTYGDRRKWPTLTRGTIKVAFMLGAVSNSSLQHEIDIEFERYGDIVQEDFVDSYANLTLKTVMGLKWVTKYCRQASYMMKIDDDSMIHQNRLLRLIQNATATNFTAAEALIDAPVLRNTSSKYYISEEYFPAATYPPYLNGPGYIVSTDLAQGLYHAATTIPVFPWEDVFLGLCLQKFGVKPIVYKDFMLIIAEYSQISDKTEAAKLFKYFVVVSNLDTEYMMLMWETCRFRLKRHSPARNITHVL